MLPLNTVTPLQDMVMIIIINKLKIIIKIDNDDNDTLGTCLEPT